jgi:hypothetical protein
MSLNLEYLQLKGADETSPRPKLRMTCLFILSQSSLAFTTFTT